MQEVETHYAPEPLLTQTVYHLGGIDYLPHYRIPNRYVGPGYGRHNVTTHMKDELLERGAAPVRMQLWAR